MLFDLNEKAYFAELGQRRKPRSKDQLKKMAISMEECVM